MSSPLETPHSTPPDSEALEDLRERLHEFGTGDCDIDDVRDALLRMCEENKDAPWEGLALLDQYQRRGLLEADVSKSLKEQVQRLVFSKQSGEMDRVARIGTPREPEPPPVESSQEKFREAFVRKSAQLKSEQRKAAPADDAHRASFQRAFQDRAKPPVPDEPPTDHGSRPAPPAFKAGSNPAQRPAATPAELQTGTLATDGTTLSDLLLPLGSSAPKRAHALTIIRGIGESLAHAHSEDRVHGDLQPENVLIASSGKIKVLNYGPANPNPQPLFFTDPPLHPSAIPVNHAAYASWERLQGAAPDERNDVYAFACISYQLLAGHHPFNGLTAVQARERGMQPSRPALLAARGWRRLRQALQLGRNKGKPVTVRELLSALDCFVAPEILPSLDEIKAQAGTPGRRRPLAWGTAVAIVAVLAAALAWVGWIPNSTTRVRPLPEDASEHAAQTGTPDAVAATAATRSPSSSSVVKSKEAAPESVATSGLGELESGPAAAPASSAGAGGPTTRPEANSDLTPNLIRDAARDTRASAALATPATAATPSPSSAAEDAAAVPGSRGVLSIAEDSYSVDAADGVARIEVRRRKSNRGAVAFKWWTEPGSARAGADYVPVSPITVRLAPGQSRAQLLVPLVVDPSRKHTEYFDVVIDEPEGGATLGGITRTTVILVANLNQ